MRQLRPGNRTACCVSKKVWAGGPRHAASESNSHGEYGLEGEEHVQDCGCCDFSKFHSCLGVVPVQGPGFQVEAHQDERSFDPAAFGPGEEVRAEGSFFD